MGPKGALLHGFVHSVFVCIMCLFTVTKYSTNLSNHITGGAILWGLVVPIVDIGEEGQAKVYGADLVAVIMLLVFALPLLYKMESKRFRAFRPFNMEEELQGPLYNVAVITPGYPQAQAPGMYTSPVMPVSPGYAGHLAYPQPVASPGHYPQPAASPGHYQYTSPTSSPVAYQPPHH